MKIRKSKINLLLIVAVTLMIGSAGANLFSFFGTDSSRVTVDSIQITWDNETMQDLAVSQDVDVCAGFTTYQYHNISWVAGNGVGELPVTYEFDSVETGLTAEVTYLGSAVDSMNLTKGVTYQVCVEISADSKMKSITTDVNLTIDVPSY